MYALKNEDKMLHNLHVYHLLMEDITVKQRT